VRLQIGDEVRGIACLRGFETRLCQQRHGDLGEVVHDEVVDRLGEELGDGHGTVSPRAGCSADAHDAIAHEADSFAVSLRVTQLGARLSLNAASPSRASSVCVARAICDSANASAGVKAHGLHRVHCAFAAAGCGGRGVAQCFEQCCDSGVQIRTRHHLVYKAHLQCLRCGN
jgi:hypothetical protein